MSYDVLYKNAVRLLEDGQALSAAPISEILCELRAECPVTLCLRARVLFEVREFDNVLLVLKRFPGGVDSHPEAVLYGMKAAFELGEIKQCVAYGEALVSSGKACTSGLCYLAKCAELSGETEKAVAYYKRALEEDPFCGEAVCALVDRNLMSGKQLYAVVDSLVFPPHAEVVRRSYRARIDTKHRGGEVRQEDIDGIPTKLVLLRAAKREYELNNLRQALSITTRLVEVDAFDRDVVCQHLAVLVDLKATFKLFEVARFLTKNKSRAELALYAIGCYYYCLANYERAGRYFCRATELECYFAEAWVALANCYARLEEGEQALNVYRRAMSLFPGLACCFTFIGMQYSRLQQWPVAMCFFEEALKISAKDPLTLNEVAVLYVRAQRLPDALAALRAAFEALPNNANPSEHCDCVVFNLATVLRKLGEYDEALKYYNLYISCRPNAGHAHCALGFTYHLLGNLKAAIARYHSALSIKPDSFCTEMLNRALAADFGHSVGGEQWGLERDAVSPAPNDISFSTMPRTPQSGSVNPSHDSMGSPQSNVGRSLAF